MVVDKRLTGDPAAIDEDLTFDTEENKPNLL